MKHTEVLKVLGIDGKDKMGKSLNNHIELATTPEATKIVGELPKSHPIRR